MHSPLPPDPYEALGVSKDAAAAAIKKAYHKLVLQTHPDKIQDDSLRAQMQDKFHKVQEAYEILTDEVRRQQYEAQVRLAERRKHEPREPTSAASFRYEVRHAAPPRDYERVYSERKASRSFDDDQAYFDRVSSKKTDPFNTPRRASRGLDESKSTRAAEDERDRARIDRERQRAADRGSYSDRRRTREKERKRDFDDKYARTVPYDDDDDSDRPRYKVVAEEPLRRKKDGDRRRENRKSDDSMRKDPGPRRTEDDEYKLDRSRKIQHQELNAREYIERSTRAVVEEVAPRPAPPHRSTTTFHHLRPAAPRDPSPVEDTVRRSHARRSSDRDRPRGSEKPKSTRKESSMREAVGIVDPPDAETRTSRMPTMPHSTSSPANIRIPSHALPRRSETFDHSRDLRGEIPSLSRASTMPVNTPSRRREPVSSASKLKHSMAEPVDSGYSSPGTPDSPPLRGSSSPPRRQDLDYATVDNQRPGRHRRAYLDDDEDEYLDRRSPSPRMRDPRPALFREVTPGVRGSPGRPKAYVIVDGDEPPSVSRVAPPYHRSSSSAARTDAGSHGRKYEYGIHSPISYSPKIGRENIVYSDARRGSGEGTYRDSPAYPSSHYVHGPHPTFLRAETSR